MSFELRQPAPLDALPECDCIFCQKQALRSSEAARNGDAVTVELFCRYCGARKTMSFKPAPDGKNWEPA